MSRMMSRMTGRVRIVKNSAPGPPFSPMVCRTPYFCGTRKSCFHRSQRSMARLLMTKSAPAKTSRRCVVFSSFNPRPLTSFIFFASAYIRSKFSASMSTRHSVAPANFSFVKISRKVGTPNDMLPAPIKTIFGVLIPCTSSSFLSKPPDCAIGSRPPFSGLRISCSVCSPAVCGLVLTLFFTSKRPPGRRYPGGRAGLRKVSLMPEPVRCRAGRAA